MPDRLEFIGEECFEESGLEFVRLPPALKAVEVDSFRECVYLKRVTFSEGLEKIGLEAFCRTGLEAVEFPASLTTVSQAAFAKCYSLKIAKFKNGLEVLGANRRLDDGAWYGVFE